MSKAKEIKATSEAKQITERASILFRCVAINGEVQNITNMLFMKKGDSYVEYCNQFPKAKVNYPTLRAAIEIDLAFAPTQTIDRIVMLKGEAKPKKVVVYPWGETSIKMKAHSLAVSMLKTWQRRQLKFNKDHDKLTGVTLFSKFSKYGTPEAKQEDRTIDITYKTVHKSFDERRALDFLNTFLKPAPAAKIVKKAA